MYTSSRTEFWRAARKVHCADISSLLTINMCLAHSDSLTPQQQQLAGLMCQFQSKACAALSKLIMSFLQRSYRLSAPWCSQSAFHLDQSNWFEKHLSSTVSGPGRWAGAHSCAGSNIQPRYGQCCLCCLAALISQL
jgi:hypothetical protein